MSTAPRRQLMAVLTFPQQRWSPSGTRVPWTTLPASTSRRGGVSPAICRDQRRERLPALTNWNFSIWDFFFLLHVFVRVAKSCGVSGYLQSVSSFGYFLLFLK